jgi:hypothetical protein
LVGRALVHVYFLANVGVKQSVSNSLFLLLDCGIVLWTLALGQFSDAGVDLNSVKKCTIGFGDGTSSGQAGDDRDLVFIDEINLCPAGAYEIQ